MTNDNELIELLKESLSGESSVNYDDWHIDFVFIGIGAEGCAIINADPSQTLLSDRKHAIIHYIAIATEAEILDSCTATQKILLPELAVSSAEQLLSYLADIPTPDIVFIAAAHAEISSSMLSSLIAQYFRVKTSATVGLAIMPKLTKDNIPNNVDSFIKATNTTLLIPQKSAYTYISKALECIIDIICVEGMICVDSSDVCTVLGSIQSNSIQDLIGTPAHIGYGIVSGDEKSDRAKCAVEKALQDINISPNKILKHSSGVVYSIRCANDITGDEIGIIGDIISEACHHDTYTIFGVLMADEHTEFEVQIIAVLEDEDA